MEDNDLLTGKILESFGFKEVGKDTLDRPIYRLKTPFSETFGYYPYEIQVVLSPTYPESNPNSGIVSVHSPECKAGAIPRDLVNKEGRWTEEEMERAKNYTVTLREWTVPVAWFVTRVGRFKSLYSSLTGQELKTA